jgi:hypothetical protein
LPRVCFENLTVPIQHQLHNNLFSAQTLSIMMQRRVSWLFSSPVILLVEKKKVFQMLLRSRVAAAPLGEENENMYRLLPRNFSDKSKKFHLNDQCGVLANRLRCT